MPRMFLWRREWARRSLRGMQRNVLEFQPGFLGGGGKLQEGLAIAAKVWELADWKKFNVFPPGDEIALPSHLLPPVWCFIGKWLVAKGMRKLVW